jgi:hypothetical protein
MSAYEEFTGEKAKIDSHLAQGFSIIGLKEDLDGTQIWLVKGEKLLEKVAIQLVNPDARKYAASLIFARQIRQDAG